jgi:hypothetical protein
VLDGRVTVVVTVALHAGDGGHGGASLSLP